MCGIAAIFSRQAPAALATARLSIIDLATGDQPIASEDERTRIIVNGEFYGFEPIQAELERGGHRLGSASSRCSTRGTMARCI